MNSGSRNNNNSYNASITRKTPSMFLFLIDRSASMAEKIEFDGEQVRKSDVVARIINTTLEEVLYRSKHIDGYYDYFDLCVIGYNNNKYEMLLDYTGGQEDFCTINMLSSYEIDKIIYERKRTLSDGQSFVTSIKVGNYIRPEASGNTPMLAALKKAYTIVRKWCDKHQELYCFPPIIFNITDGEASDSSQRQLIDISSRIKELCTHDGNVLFFNIHLSKSTEGTSIVFPTSLSELHQEDRYAKLLYEMSSSLPLIFYPEIAAIKGTGGIDPSKKIKALGYNANITDILRIINIGSISITKIK